MNLKYINYQSLNKNKMKDLNYYKNNCEENYITTPISVLRYITELEKDNEAKLLLLQEPKQKTILLTSDKVRQ